MKRNWKAGVCAALCSAMVFTGIGPVLTPYLENAVVYADENENSGVKKVFTADQLKVAWGDADYELADGQWKLSFAKQYNQVKWTLPESIEMSQVNAVTFQVADQKVPISLKVYNGGDDATAANTQYGLSGQTEYTINPSGDGAIDAVGIMITEDKPENATVSLVSVTFELKAGAGDAKLGDNIIKNGDFAASEAAESWNSAAGESVVSVAAEEEEIADSGLKTYGVLTRNQETATPGDCFSQDISAQSPYYKDFLEKKDASEYHDLFIRYKDFWENGEPTEEQVDAIYKRKPRAPYVEAHFADGTSEKVWCTFDEEQIDINCKSETAKRFIRDNLTTLCEHGAAMIRLDAFAYATKKAGTSCFFIEPDVWEFLKECEDIVKPYGVTLLPEIHEHYTMQEKIAKEDYYVYDFALPMLLINALYYGQTQYLKHWFEICPRKQFTTLDTHDGIGVVDVKDLLPDEEIGRTKEDIFKFGANVKKIYNTAAYNNLDIYQVNCSYYSALGDEDDAYLLARAVQFFAPGIPQVYYVGLLAGKNDLKLLEETKVGRNINRHYYTKEEIDAEVKRPVVAELLRMMEFRNAHPAFDGTFELETSDDDKLVIVRRNGDAWAKLSADFKAKKFEITYTEDGEVRAF